MYSEKGLKNTTTFLLAFQNRYTNFRDLISRIFDFWKLLTPGLFLIAKPNCYLIMKFMIQDILKKRIVC